MSEKLPKIEGFDWEKSPMSEAYRLLGAIDPQDLQNKYTAAEQIAFKSRVVPIMWDYNNPDQIQNKVKEIIEQADTSGMDEIELEIRERIIWFWYHHAISVAGWHKDKEKMKFFSEKAMEYEDESNVLTRTMYLLVHDRIEEAEDWIKLRSIDPVSQEDIETCKEMIENYKKTVGFWSEEETDDSKESFDEELKSLQRRMFGNRLKNDSYVLTQPGSEHSYFSPYHHFEKGLVTEELVEDLKSHPDEKILSVGAGPAFLEQLLVEMGIDKERFVLSDKDTEVMPEGFVNIELNMYGQWPNNLGKFSLILFPESVRIHSDKPSEVFELLLKRALGALEDDGEIRMDGHGQNTKVTDKIEAHLREQGYKVEIKNNGKLLVATKISDNQNGSL
ncbi:MAG: hypothetical protein KBC78_03160 [Candidatus Pacebacteria bacterium]|nr:hypothetical protein [Candidatus Paceibacterota bacterium]